MDQNISHTLYFPKGYVIPRNITELSPNELANLFNIIESLIDKFRINYNEINKSDIIAELELKYNKDLSSVMKSKDVIIDNLTDQIKKLNGALANIYTEKISPLHEEMNKLREAHTLEMRREIRELSDKYEEKLEKAYLCESQKNKDDILKKLEPIAKFYEGSNSEKGALSEAAIAEILSESYKEAIVEDVSAQTAAGDILFKWRQIKCLIEIKNKSIITKDDIDKFIRDVFTCSENMKINCAIFISLRTNKIPSKSKEPIQLEYQNGIPVIYAHMPPPSKEIHYAISCLDKILSFAQSNEKEEMHQYFIDYYKHIINYRRYFEKELNKKQREVKALYKNLEQHNKLYEQLEPLYFRISPKDAIEKNADIKNCDGDKCNDDKYDSDKCDDNNKNNDISDDNKKDIKINILRGDTENKNGVVKYKEKDNKDNKDNKDKQFILDRTADIVRQLAEGYNYLKQKKETTPTILDISELFGISKREVATKKLKNIIALAATL